MSANASLRLYESNIKRVQFMIIRSQNVFHDLSLQNVFW